MDAAAGHAQDLDRGGGASPEITSRRKLCAHTQGHSRGHICMVKSEYSPCAISTFVSGHDSKILTRFYLRVTGSGDHCILFFTTSGEFIHKRLMFLNQRL